MALEHTAYDSSRNTNILVSGSARYRIMSLEQLIHRTFEGYDTSWVKSHVLVSRLGISESIISDHSAECIAAFSQTPSR